MVLNDHVRKLDLWLENAENKKSHTLCMTLIIVNSELTSEQLEHEQQNQQQLVQLMLNHLQQEQQLNLQ
jgi:hypothetical protein